MTPADIIDTHLELPDGDTMPPLMAIEIADGVVLATYDGNHQIDVPLRTDDGELRLRYGPLDEPYLLRLPDDTDDGISGAAAIAGMQDWIDVEIPLIDHTGTPLLGLRIMDVTEGDRQGRVICVVGDDDSAVDIDLVDKDGKAARAIWSGEHLIGISYERGDAIDETQIERINARLSILQTRHRGEWRVVKDECVRLGGVPPVDIRPGDHVKIGFQPLHPMPGDAHVSAEWMWLEVVDVRDGGTDIDGRLNSYPQAFETPMSLVYDDLVTFSNRDVYAVERA